MKKLLTLIALGMSAAVASAQTAILYQETFGSTNGGTTLAAVGWSQVLATAGWSGIYAQPGAHDGTTALALPTNTLYFGASGAGIGMFFTTNGAGSGSGGDSAYTSINPTLYTNLEISVECQWSWNGGNLGNWFAVEVGGSWYVATNQPMSTPQHSAGSTFYKSIITYNPAATNWNVLTNTTIVGIGGPAPGNLSGQITGIGVVVSLAAAGSWNYNNFLITSISNTIVLPPTIGAAPLSQTNYAGAGVSFAVAANGTGPFTYQWRSNGVPLVNGGRFSGATNSVLTITNINSGDSGSAYSVIVSNSAGVFDTSTNSTATLTVDVVPAAYLYAETIPFVGPLVTTYPIGRVGWSNSIPDGPDRVYQTAGGDGAAFAFEGYAWTQAFYTTTASDTGVSGLPFPSINPAAYPAISFSVDINPTYLPANVTAYFAVQMGGANWYVSQTPVPVNTGGSGFATYQQQFDPNAIQWNTLTLSATSATIGSQPGSNLSGNITGAGLIFVTTSGGGSLGFDNFLITTNTAPAIAPSITYAPLSQTVFVGGGASFAVKAVGTQPLSYYWQSNQVPLVDGGRFSGTRTNVLTILNVDANDQAIYSVIVSNSVSTDDSINYAISGLTVNSVPPGLLYAEMLPYVGPAPAGDFPLSLAGWANAIPDNPNRLYQNSGGDGAAYAYEGSGPVATAFYTTTSLDTGTSGLSLPSINTTLYGGISFSVDLAPTLNPANVTTYFAVQMNGGGWVVSANAIPVPGVATNVFTTYTQTFNPAAPNWKTLTLSGTSATIGGTVSGNLSGNITGAGLVTSFTGAGNVNFDNFYITTTTGVSAPGGIIISSIANNGQHITFSWIGSPNIHLQSTTNLAPAVWQDVPNTTGQSTATVTNTVPKMFYRLIWP
jgi:hypothetical protein